MANSSHKVVLITGASSGIGKACATYLHQQGYVVYGTSRKPENVSLDGPTMISMDVSNADSVRQAVQKVLDQHGRIDVLVNNAGVGITGALEDTSVEEAMGTFDTNFFGLHRVCREVIPGMRQQGFGKIINISSIAGHIALPFRGFYSASKAAVERYSETLRMELESFGIQVSIIDPGSIRTPINQNRTVAAESQSENSAYRNAFSRQSEIMHSDVEKGLDPLDVGRQVHAIIQHATPELRYFVAHAKQRIAVTLSRLLPAKLFLKILKKNYRVDR